VASWRQAHKKRSILSPETMLERAVIASEFSDLPSGSWPWGKAISRVFFLVFIINRDGV